MTNKFKGEGSHIFVVGVGNVTESSIWEISGLDEFELGVNNIGNSDYAVGSFAELSNGLTVLAVSYTHLDVYKRQVDMFGQITHITGSPQTATSTTNVVAIAKPTTLQVGDIMIATISFSETTSNTDLDVDASATDWIVVDGFFSGDIGGADEIGITVLYKIATASDVLATNFSFTTDAASEDCMGSIVAFRGVDNASPFDVVGTFNDTESDDLLADPITTTLTNSCLLYTSRCV